MHLTIIVGDHGEHWRHLPLVARNAGTTVLFVDHRMSPRQRAAACRDACDPASVVTFERVVSDPCPTDCEAGVHPWERMREDLLTVAGRCPACGLVELIEPLTDLQAREFAQAN